MKPRPLARAREGQAYVLAHRSYRNAAEAFLGLYTEHALLEVKAG